MPIVRFTRYRNTDDNPNGLHQAYYQGPLEAWEEGAYCPFGYDNSPAEVARVGALVLWETHQGLCLYEREANYYDDSDFYMTVWNPTLGKTEEIMFATTRGWSYPSLGSSVDATEETLTAFYAYRDAQAKIAEVARAGRGSKISSTEGCTTAKSIGNMTKL